MPRPGKRTRRIAAVSLFVAGSLLLLAGDLLLYAERNVLDSDRFAANAVQALDDEATRDEIGAIVADQLERRVDRDLVAFRAIIEAAAAAIADTEPFRLALRSGIAEAHALAFGDAQDSAAVKVANFGVLIDGALRAVDPQAAKAVPDGFTTTLISLSEGGAAVDVIQIDLGPLPYVAPLLGLALLIASAFAATDRRAAATRAALAVAAVGALVVAAYFAGQAIVSAAADGSGAEAAVRSLWSALLGDLRDWNIALCLSAAVVAGASASLLRPVDAGARLGRVAGGFLRTPSSRPGAALRAALLLALGVAVLLAPDVALRLLMVGLGLALAFVGASELLALVAGPAPAERRAAGDERDRERRRPLLLGALALAGAGLVVLVAAGGGDEAPAPPSGCNGSEALCERGIDEVVFPATHNSMAAADYPGWVFPMHDRTIAAQLEDGVRGLLIDAYYGFPGRRVYTNFERGPNKLREQAEATLGPEFIAAADSVRSDLSRPEGAAGLYLCHGFCELGAIELGETLEGVDAFLERNPGEVVLVVIEDYVSPADVVDAFQRSGLAERAYAGPLGPRFPTLGELVEAGDQVIVLAENRAGSAPWYRLAYEFFQETPFDFSSPADMSCARNRGAASNPLFLINNWINTDPAARPSNAARVNARAFLLDRARKCARNRGLVPNLIAVDFYREGDLLGVAEELNEED